MNRTLRLADAFTRYQRRHGLTTAGLAVHLAVPEVRIGYLARWSIADSADRPFAIMARKLAEFYLCDPEGLAVILLEAMELTNA